MGRIGNLLRKTQCERGDILQTRRNLFFQSQMDESKPLEGDQEMRTSTFGRHRPIQGESHVDFLGEPEGSLPQPHDSLPVAGEAMNDFWCMSGRFIYRHHIEPSVKLYSPREESFPIPLKYIDVTRTTHDELGCQARESASMIIGKHRRVSRTCLIVGQISHNLLHSTKKLLTDICGPGGRLTKKTAYIQARSSMARTMEVNGKECQAKGEGEVV